MVRISILLAIISFSTLSFGQKKGAAFKLKGFNEKFNTVLWLYEYDAIAWHTTDSVMTHDQSELQKLGQEWFCFKDQHDIWHAVYGRLNNDTYDLAFHYTVDTAFNVRKSIESIEPELLNSYARALKHTHDQLTQLKDTVAIRFNQFIKRNDDKSFDVWILPAFQPNGVAVYGGEFYFKLDATGNHIVAKDIYVQDAFRGFKIEPPREIWLNYRELNEPTLGSIFFAWYYKTYFTSISIDNRDYFSAPFKEGDKYTWVHVAKQESKANKKKK